MKKIYFDLDGTIYDLYNFPNWLEMLRKSESPFYELTPLIDLKVLNNLMDRIKMRDIATFEIISWLPMDANSEFEEICTDDKIERVHEDFGHNMFAYGHFLKYGTPKDSVVLERLTKDHILIDDNLEILEQWEIAGGKGVEASKILQFLKGLL